MCSRLQAEGKIHGGLISSSAVSIGTAVSPVSPNAFAAFSGNLRGLRETESLVDCANLDVAEAVPH